MSRAAGVRKPNETQKPKTVWNMKNSNATGTVGRAPQRPDCGTGYSVDVHGEFVLGLIFGPRLCGGTGLQWLAQASSKVCGIRPIWEAFGPTWTRGLVCVYARHPWSGMCQGSTGRMASSFFFLALSSMLTSALPFFSADVLKKCALIGLHLMAGEGRGGKGLVTRSLSSWRIGGLRGWR